MTASVVERRDRIRLMGLSGALSARLPPPVRPGDRVGVAALSGKVEPAALERGVGRLRALGFEVVPAANLGARHGLFAGRDDERLAGFHQLLADPTLKAIFFARGGHGVLRLLPRIDWEGLARHPRAYVGYSDLTPLLLEIVRRQRQVTFHGPMVAADLGRRPEEGEADALLAALAGAYPAEVPLTPVAGGGVVEGPLVGGCLSLLASTLGTDFAPRLAGGVLFWEDVDEPLYRVDRMLNQLKLSGSLAGIRAMIVGRIELTDAGQGELLDHLLDWAQELDVPVLTGCASGHCRPNLTLPLGLRARVEVASGRLILGPPRDDGS